MKIKEKISIAVLTVLIALFARLITVDMQVAEHANGAIGEDVIPYKSKVLVANGCGMAGIASQFRELLLKNGFIVYSPQNEDYWTYSESIVLSLDGNMDAAREVAKSLKIDNCLMYKMNESYESVKVIIGKDYKEILEKNGSK